MKEAKRRMQAKGVMIPARRNLKRCGIRFMVWFLFFLKLCFDYLDVLGFWAEIERST
jgi:hypothetical protein